MNDMSAVVFQFGQHHYEGHTGQPPSTCRAT